MCPSQFVCPPLRSFTPYPSLYDLIPSTTFNVHVSMGTGISHETSLRLIICSVDYLIHIVRMNVHLASHVMTTHLQPVIVYLYFLDICAPSFTFSVCIRFPVFFCVFISPFLLGLKVGNPVVVGTSSPLISMNFLLTWPDDLNYLHSVPYNRDYPKLLAYFQDVLFILD